ncbi:MAG TPA: hypothetical protein VGJ14_06585 [Sporichthyaceae bacterium]
MRRRVLIFGAAAVLAGGIGGVLIAHAHGSGDSSGSAMVAKATAMMGFDLSKTVHSFTDTADGGIQEVVADSPDDASDIAAIRAHLSRIAGQFTAGDFSDPAAMHGADMPGLAQMQSGADRMQITYSQLPTGGRIAFRSDDPAQVEAIHRYFAAQRHDHSMPGMGMGH